MAENIYNRETLTSNTRVRISELLSYFDMRNMEPWKRGIILYSLLITRENRESISQLYNSLCDIESSIKSHQIWSTGAHYGICQLNAGTPCLLCKYNALKARGEHVIEILQIFRSM